MFVRITFLLEIQIPLVTVETSHHYRTVLLSVEGAGETKGQIYTDQPRHYYQFFFTWLLKSMMSALECSVLKRLDPGTAPTLITTTTTTAQEQPEEHDEEWKMSFSLQNAPDPNVTKLQSLKQCPSIQYILAFWVLDEDKNMKFTCRLCCCTLLVHVLKL